MFNGKVKLTDLKVKSFVTILDKAQQEQTKGGLAIFKGKKSNTNRFSWGVTIIDTRADDNHNASYMVTTRRKKN